MLVISVTYKTNMTSRKVSHDNGSEERRRFIEVKTPDDNQRSRNRRPIILRQPSINQINTIDETTGPDSKEVFRKILRELYEEQEKKKNAAEGEATIDQKINYEKVREKKRVKVQRNQLITFLVYLATEHEHLVAFVIFLPLILAAFYIIFIENSSLFK